MDSNLRSSSVLSNLKKIKFMAFKRFSLKNISGQSSDILPGQLQCLRLHKSPSIDAIFTQRNNCVLIFGDISIVEFSTEDSVSYYLGILLSSGMLLLYEYDKDDRKILYFRIGINIRGSIVTIDNEVIIIKSNIQIVLKVQDNYHMDVWYQKLCQASTNIEVVVKPRLSLVMNSIKMKRKPDRGISERFKSQVEYMKSAWKLPESMKSISNNSWSFDNAYLPSLKYLKNPQLTDPKVSDDSFLIDSNFEISSIILYRVSSTGITHFIESKACLTQYLLTIMTKEIKLSVEMENCNLETIADLKWGVRVNSPLYRIDIKLTSKLSYERWILALMKIVSFHSRARCSTTIISGHTDSLTPTQTYENKSINDVLATRLKLTRSHSCSYSLPEIILLKDRRRTWSDILLCGNHININYNSITTNSQPPFDDALTNSPSTPNPRIRPQRNSSCLDHPIPILPDFRLSKSFVGSCDFGCLEIGSIYDEMEPVCCGFEKHFNIDKTLTPLPVRCERHGIAKRFKRSCQQFSRKLIKSSEFGKIEKGANKSFLSIISNKFKSETNLQTNNSKFLRSKSKGRFYWSDISRSVFDIRGPRSDVFARKHSQVETIPDGEESEYEDECEYEEPACGPPMSI